MPSTIADPEAGSIDDLVSDRHRLDQPARLETAARQAHATLRSLGAVIVPGFLTDDAVAEIAAELERAARHVPIREHAAGVYHRSALEADLAPDDPRCVRQHWYAGHVTRDMIPAYSAAHRLYVSPQFKRFVAGCVGRERVYEYADPMAGLVATILPPGGRYPWHYDTNEFVVTIVIREPDEGGVFEYCKDLRRPGDENLDGLARVLDGSDRSSVRTSCGTAGDLQIFMGRYSLHRITEVRGSAPRHVLVLSYSDRPGVIGPLDRTRSVYGRVTEAHLIAAEQQSTGPDGLVL